MYLFLLPLLAGFLLNAASAFTTFYSQRWGERRGQVASALLRNILGIPLWVVGLILAFRTPAPRLWDSSGLLSALGYAAVIAGAILTTWALSALRLRAAAPSMKDTLVRHGPYAHIRHPIYTSMFLDFAGLAIIQPTTPMLLSSLFGIGWAIIQTRLEEMDLLQRLPGYAEYMRQTPRFLPRWRS